jgi:aryl-alcohol dehydrogenase-like predicted oxidoreductase
MEYRKIQGTSFKSSVIGFGTWGLSGDSYGKISKEKSKSILKHAFNKEINFFDTAALYGNGYVEELLGETFSCYEKQKIIISTKIGMVENKKNIFLPKFNFNIKFLQRGIFKSLKRLRVDSLDILQLHSPKKDFIKSQKFLEIVNLLKENKKKGNLKYYGISVQNPEDALYILKKQFGFNTIQINFNLLDMREYDLGIFKLAKKYKVSIITRTPMAMGLLRTNKLIINKTKDHRIRFSSQKLEQFRSVSKKLALEFNDQLSLKALALKFSVFDDIICTTLPGMMEKTEINANVQSIYSKFSVKKNLKKICTIYKKFYFV